MTLSCSSALYTVPMSMFRPVLSLVNLRLLSFIETLICFYVDIVVHAPIKCVTSDSLRGFL